jgi:hypothetical protein
LGFIDDELFPRDERLPFCVEPRFATCGLHIEIGTAKLLGKGCLAALTRTDQRDCGEPLELGTDLPCVDAWNHVLHYGNPFPNRKHQLCVHSDTAFSRGKEHVRQFPQRQDLMLPKATRILLPQPNHKKPPVRAKGGLNSVPGTYEKDLAFFRRSYRRADLHADIAWLGVEGSAQLIEALVTGHGN